MSFIQMELDLGRLASKIKMIYEMFYQVICKKKRMRVSRRIGIEPPFMFVQKCALPFLTSYEGVVAFVKGYNLE